MTPRATGPLIDALAEARVLGEPAGEVEVIETHMSWVLLAGEHAYKIKKPVDLGFADFSTLDLRRHYCREELRINRRLAPPLYVDVVPIYGKPEVPRLDATGEPIEYVVKMRRFRQEDRLDHVLDRDALTPDEVDDAIRQMADFHGRVEVDVDRRGFGTPEAIQGPMRDCFESLADIAPDFGIAESLDRVRRWSDAEFDARRAQFAARKRDGFIRECHGDVHLANMARWDRSVVIFDAIEFNENLRWIDVQNELAFLVMDLEDRSRIDLARRALNRYLEITGDYRGLALLPYYLTYRALVRAKVDRIRLNQPDTNEHERNQLRRQLAGYVRLAEGYSDRPSPRLVITRGVAATGKTTAASRLVEQLGAVRIRSDVERKRLFGLDPLARTGSEVNEGLYSPGHTRRCYEQLADLTETVLQAGFTAVVDASFLRRYQRTAFFELARRLGVRLAILDLHADEATLRQRIARREAADNDVSEAGMAVLNEQLRSQEPLVEQERETAIRVDTDAPDWLDILGEALSPRVCESRI